MSDFIQNGRILLSQNPSNDSAIYQQQYVHFLLVFF